jgi:predicted alpha/beta superfamily hydrolase
MNKQSKELSSNQPCYDEMADWSVCYHMTRHLTRRSVLKTVFCGVAYFGMPDLLGNRRIFSVYPALASAQEYNPGYELGEKIYVPVRSSVLNEDRTAEVILPPEFKAGSDEKYDAIYILDGIRAYHYVAYDYLRGEGFIPKRTILVGLLGRKDTPTRYRDFTPTQASPDSGGADRYLQFLKKELIPVIDQKFRTDAERSALVGGSMGGLFVIHALLNEATLFKSYVALDPSLWWDRGVVNAEVQRKIGSLKGLNRVLWINGREGEGMREMRIDRLEAILRAQAPSGFTWKSRAYANETHLTTWIKGFWDGVKYCYGGYYPHGIGFKPMNGIVLKDAPFHVWCYEREASSYIRYTLDGSEPTLTSPRVSLENTFRSSKDATIRIKAFCAREEYNTTAAGNFRVGAALPGIEQPNDVVAGGLRFAYYAGEWDAPRDVAGLKPDRVGRADRDFDFGRLPADATFICVLDGFLRIDTDAYYVFSLSDQGHSKVFLGDIQVIGDHFDPGGGESCIVPLRKGFHPFRVVYFHRKGQPNLAPVYCKQDRQEDSPIPLDHLYGRT